MDSENDKPLIIMHDTNALMSLLI